MQTVPTGTKDGCYTSRNRKVKYYYESLEVLFLKEIFTKLILIIFYYYGIYNVYIIYVFLSVCKHLFKETNVMQNLSEMSFKRPI